MLTSQKRLLIIIVGYPASGKSSLAKKLHDSLSRCKSVITISENDFGNRNEIYSDRKQEMQMRSSIRSKVDSALSNYQVVILDAMNHIKSFRYELFCLVKAHSASQCLFFIKTDKELSIKLNNNRSLLKKTIPDLGNHSNKDNDLTVANNDSESFNRTDDNCCKYDNQLIESIFNFFEFPNPENRWDKPMIFVENPFCYDCSNLLDLLYNNSQVQKLRPNQSTAPLKMISDDFLSRVNAVVNTTNSDINKLINNNNMSQLSKLYNLNPNINQSQLLMLKRNFIAYIKNNPVESDDSIRSMYITFLSNKT